MGSSLSQEAASQQSEESNKILPGSCASETEVTGRPKEGGIPQNFEAIIRNADSVIDRSFTEKLYDQLYAGVFLNQRGMKYWIDKKSNVNSFMVFAKDLAITWAEDSRFWQWPCLKETSDAYINVAELLNVCWLEVHGQFEIAKLSPGLVYEVAFIVMLKDPAYGWEIPVNLRLIMPDKSIHHHKECLMEKGRGKWIEILVGEFQTSPGNVGEIEFSLYEYEGGKWKKGLIIKGVTIRPKS
ncbi:Phloem protein 2-like [Dillenia turbinata]|uniref:Phloem protein 2-like n=1 Tax=Dillenia turbinata TaxID=194707 RepID=A0AAN8VL69_9MAGN